MYQFCEVDVVLMLIGADSVVGGWVEIGLLLFFVFFNYGHPLKEVFFFFSKIYDLSLSLLVYMWKNKCFTSLSG